MANQGEENHYPLIKTKKQNLFSMLNDIFKVCHAFIPKLCVTVPLACFSLQCIAQTNAPITPIDEVSNIGQIENQPSDFLSNKWRVNGFATIGYADTDKYPDAVLRRNLYQSSSELRRNSFKLDSRIGVQLSKELSERWDVVLQGVLKHQHILHVTDYIDVAMLRYQASNEWQISLGRQPFDLFFMSDHRNVGYSYDWVRPPSEFYGFVSYDYLDGAKFIRRWGDFDNEWSLSFTVGLLEDASELISFDAFDPRDDNVSSDNCSSCGPPQGPNQPGFGAGQGSTNSNDTTTAKPIYNTEITLHTGNWRLRANYAYLKFELEVGGVPATGLEEIFSDTNFFWPGVSELLQASEIQEELHYVSVGGSWESGGWKVQTEISHSEAATLAFAGQRGYLHIRRRWGDWSPFLTFGFARDDSSLDIQPLEEVNISPDVPFYGVLLALENEFQSITSVVRQNQNNISVGVRWDFAHEKALKFQCDRIRTDAQSGSIHDVLGRDFSQSVSRSWCSATFDWVF